MTMRKNIIFILLVFLSSNMFCQNIIQNKFWGYFFGMNKEIVKSGFNRDNIYFTEDQNSLTLYDQNFAGYLWKFVDMQFYNEKFYSIDFSSYYKRKADALEYYNFFKDKLDKKYNTVYQYEENEDNMKKKVFFDECNSCFIILKHSESDSGEMHWYFALSYWNNSLNDERINSNNDEL